MPSATHLNRPTFESVYRGQFEFVWRSLRALGVHHGALDDALQDVFVVVHRRLPQFEGRATVKTWVYEIARRVALRYRTRAARHANRHSELPELTGKDDLDAAVDAARAADLLASFLETLDEDRRRAFVLAEFWDMPGREIAEALDVNMNTIYARLRSARTELDRVAHRLRARDSGALTRSLREDRPSAATRQRTLAAVFATVGKPAVLGVASSTGLGTLGWAAVGAAAGGVLLTGVVGLADARAPAPRSATTVAPISPASAAAKPAGRPPKQTPSPPSPPTDTTPLSAAADPPLADSVSKAAPLPTRPTAAPAPQQHTDPPSLTDELAAVRQLRRAVADSNEERSREGIRAYRKKFPNGTLEIEVDALEVELACRTQDPAARSKLQTFRSATNGDALIPRLNKICAREIGPQKPAGGGTPP